MPLAKYFSKSWTMNEWLNQRFSQTVNSFFIPEKFKLFIFKCWFLQQNETFKQKKLTSMYEWFPYGTSLYLSNVKLIFLDNAESKRAVCPHAAFISDQSTGAEGRRPKRKLFMVPKWPWYHIWKVALNTFVFFSLSSCVFV